MNKYDDHAIIFPGGDFILEYLVLLLCALAIVLLYRYIAVKGKVKSRYDSRGFDHNGIHKNGTKFDDRGYDYFGFDKNGYNWIGFNRTGRNSKGQYDRYYDLSACDEEGFWNPRQHPISLTPHACKRLQERLGIADPYIMDQQVIKAYRRGKSKRQIKKTSAYLLEDIEQRHPGSVALIYSNYIYIFSYDNVLITVFKNDRIPL